MGEIVGIRIVGNPIPFAVGKSEIDGQMIDALRENNHAGWKKGKCVSIVHIFGDLLWQHCRDHLRGADIPGVNDPMTLAYPNVGFSRQSLSVTSIEQECVTATPESASESSDMKGEDGKGEPSDIKESFEAPVKECCEEEISNIVEGTESLHISSEADIIDLPDATDEPVILTTIPPEIMDNLLIISLLRTLKYLIKDKDLPMLTSAFWSIVTRL